MLLHFGAHYIVFHDKAVANLRVERALGCETVCGICRYRAFVEFVDVKIDGGITEFFCAVFYETERARAEAFAAHGRVQIKF